MCQFIFKEVKEEEEKLLRKDKRKKGIKKLLNIYKKKIKKFYSLRCNKGC